MGESKSHDRVSTSLVHLTLEPESDRASRAREALGKLFSKSKPKSYVREKFSVTSFPNCHTQSSSRFLSHSFSVGFTRSKEICVSRTCLNLRHERAGQTKVS